MTQQEHFQTKVRITNSYKLVYLINGEEAVTAATEDLPVSRREVLFKVRDREHQVSSRRDRTDQIDLKEARNIKVVKLCLPTS